MSQVEKPGWIFAFNSSGRNSISQIIKSLSSGINVVELQLEFHHDLLPLLVHNHIINAQRISLLVVDATNKEKRLNTMASHLQNRTQTIPLVAFSNKPELLVQIKYPHTHIFRWPITNQKEFSEKVFELLKDTAKD